MRDAHFNRGEIRACQENKEDKARQPSVVGRLVWLSLYFYPQAFVPYV